MDLEQARTNMVEQQIRPWEVIDQEVLDLLYVVPREEFVPPQYRSLAFADIEIPIGEGERMWFPKIEAKVLQALGARKTDKVLEVGTGSGAPRTRGSRSMRRARLRCPGGSGPRGSPSCA